MPRSERGPYRSRLGLGRGGWRYRPRCVADAPRLGFVGPRLPYLSRSGPSFRTFACATACRRDGRTHALVAGEVQSVFSAGRAMKLLTLSIAQTQEADSQDLSQLG